MYDTGRNLLYALCSNKVVAIDIGSGNKVKLFMSFTVGENLEASGTYIEFCI